jgi:hypothetical protein
MRSEYDELKELKIETYLRWSSGKLWDMVQQNIHALQGKQWCDVEIVALRMHLEELIRRDDSQFIYLKDKFEQLLKCVKDCEEIFWKNVEVKKV